jgi:hypothetical protein
MYRPTDLIPSNPYDLATYLCESLYLEKSQHHEWFRGILVRFLEANTNAPLPPDPLFSSEELSRIYDGEDEGKALTVMEIRRQAVLGKLGLPFDPEEEVPFEGTPV